MLVPFQIADHPVVATPCALGRSPIAVVREALPHFGAHVRFFTTVQAKQISETTGGYHLTQLNRSSLKKAPTTCVYRLAYEKLKLRFSPL